MHNRTLDTATRRAKYMAARASFCVNIVLVAIKLGVGAISGSVSVLSEAAHSATDLLASSLALYAVLKADIPPDIDHPFGHGKVESLSALVQSVVLFGVAAYVVYEAVEHLIHRIVPQRLDLGIAVMVFAAVVNVFFVRYEQGVAAKTDSQALRADAQDHRADIYAAVGVMIGLLLVRITGFGAFDPLLALGVAAVIVGGAWHVLHGAVGQLVDRNLPLEETRIIEELIEKDDVVLAYHALRTRKAGSTRHVDAHVLMEDDLSLLRAHEAAEHLERRIREALPNTIVNLHVEPFHDELLHQYEEHGGSPPDL